MGVSDVFLLNSIRKGIMKGGLKAMAKNYKYWSSYRNFYEKSGFIKSGGSLHHSFSARNGQIYGSGLRWRLKNQMWNLRPFDKFSSFKLNHSYHMRFGHGKSWLGPAGSKLGAYWYGTPTWSKYFILSSGTRTIQGFRNYDD